jgi:hypothetical protein
MSDLSNAETIERPDEELGWGDRCARRIVRVQVHQKA